MRVLGGLRLPAPGGGLDDGWIALADGRITAVGQPGEAPPAGAQVRELGAVALLPGLVNAHTHIELSWLRGRVPPVCEDTREYFRDVYDHLVRVEYLIEALRDLADGALNTYKDVVVHVK